MLSMLAISGPAAPIFSPKRPAQEALGNVAGEGIVAPVEERAVERKPRRLDRAAAIDAYVEPHQFSEGVGGGTE